MPTPAERRVLARNQVGDILTVKVNINDTAQFNDQAALNRTTTEDTEITNFIGANTIKNSAAASPQPPHW